MNDRPCEQCKYAVLHLLRAYGKGYCRNEYACSSANGFAEFVPRKVNNER